MTCELGWELELLAWIVDVTPLYIRVTPQTEMCLLLKLNLAF